MKIFYIEQNAFKKTYNKDFLIQYADIEIKTEKRFYEYTIGRYLIKQVAKKYYGIDESKIIKSKTGKPIFEKSDLHFNISHSNNIVIACFDKYPCSIDIEYMKPRNLIKFSKYYNKDFKNLEDFYKFWTKKEAVYKLNEDYKNIYFKKLNEHFLLAIATTQNVDNESLKLINFTEI